MKKVVKSILARGGLKLVRLPVESRAQSAPADSETTAIESIIAKFAEQHPAGTELADKAKWRSYLSNRRINFFTELVQRVSSLDFNLAHKRICDLGSGTGFLLRVIHQHESTTELIGFDTFKEVNVLAKMICPAAEFIASDNPSDSEPFDLIFCTQVLEHMINPVEQIQTLLTALNAGGYLILTVPDGRTDTHPALGQRTDGTGYWGHINFWSPESWVLFIESCCKGQATFDTGKMEQGQNYAFIRKQ